MTTQVAQEVIVELGEWKVIELSMSQDKIRWLWNEIRNFRTLFSDFTRGDVNNFANLVAMKESLWLEVLDSKDETIGIVYWTNLGNVMDVDVHLMFFDRQPAEKAELCKLIAKWFFNAYPQCNRMTATIPILYHATVRLADRIGFKREGRKRESQMIGCKVMDEIIFGLLAREVAKWAL